MKKKNKPTWEKKKKGWSSFLRLSFHSVHIDRLVGTLMNHADTSFQNEALI